MAQAQSEEQKPAFEKYQKIKKKTCCEMFLTIFKQVWFLFRSLVDTVIDQIFALAIYDDRMVKKIPKAKDDIILESGVSLASKIRNKEVTSEFVVTAFIERIKEINPLINALVDDCFSDAVKQAQEADRLINSNKFTLEELERNKPFLGVPFTTKETTSCKGLNFTFGLIARRKEKGQEDAELVKLMKEAGGILLGVSNVPELNMWCETRNNLYGQTLNPYNTNRTVGGSSGGEAALLTTAASPLGIGTDIGGSLRMPAFFCGVYGHKPTTGLTPMKGTTRRTGEEKHSIVTAGPMAKYPKDLKAFLKVLAKDKIHMINLDADVNMKNINIFYMEQSNDVRSSAVCSELTSAMRKVVDYCKEASGKPCKKVNLEGMQYSYRLWRYWVTKEPYQMSEELGNRERNICIATELAKKLIGRSEFTLAALIKVLDQYLPQEKPSWAEEQTEKLKHDILELLGDNGVLLYPSHSFPASYHYSAFLRPYNFSFWAIFNVLRLPVTQIPLGLSSDGLPLGIQVVAGPYKDHLCLAVAEELEKALGGWIAPFPI